MNGIELLRNTVLVVFALDALLLLSLVIGKGIHRRREDGQENRRIAYLALLSRHLAMPEEVLHLGPKVAGDQAFLDALIDIRTSVVGPESDALSEVVERYGVMERYSKRLASPFFLTRRLRAAVALAEVADSSWAPVLMKHLSDREPEIRIQAARGLGRMRWTPAIDAIVGRFEEETPWVRSRFADTLIRFGTRATWPLVAYIKVNHRFESTGATAAIRTLATIGDDQAVHPLIEVMEESYDPEVQLAAIEALGILAGPIAIDPLATITGHFDWRIRAKAASALGSIGDPTAIPFLVPGLTDPEWWVRRNSAAGLAHVPGGIESLYDAISSDDPFARDAAAEALFDAGEVIAARRRIETGEAARPDRDLIAYIESATAVSA